MVEEFLDVLRIVCYIWLSLDDFEASRNLRKSELVQKRIYAPGRPRLPRKFLEADAILDNKAGRHAILS